MSVDVIRNSPCLYLLLSFGRFLLCYVEGLTVVFFFHLKKFHRKS